MEISSIDNGDRLSELPQNITDAILSRFTTKHAIKNTSLLSKRWRYAWTTCPNLVFKRQEFASDHNFIEFVNRTLEIRGESPLTTFQLYWNNVDLGCTSTWLHYAMRQRVQEIVMHVCIAAPSRSSEQEQWLSLCFLNLPNSINLTNLRCLHLRYVQCSNMLLEKLICSCTLLESLELSTHFESINITAPNLKKLHLNHTHGSVQISAPKLESMVCNLYALAEISPTEDFKFLVDADVLYSKNLKGFNKNKLVKFLKSLYNAKVLTLKGHVIKVLSELDLTKQLFPVFHNLKHLSIHALLDTKNIGVIVTLLRRCPSLEKLVLSNTGEGQLDASGDYEAPWQLGDVCKLSSLKDIVISGFFGEEAEFQFVKFLLEKANTLRVININGIFRHSGYCKVISKELLAFCKASSHAKVVINKDYLK